MTKTSATKTSAVTFHRWNDMPKEKVTETIDRRVVCGERMMLAHVYLAKGAVVPRHMHENEQLTYILEGALKFWIGDDGAQEIRRARTGSTAPTTTFAGNSRTAHAVSAPPSGTRPGRGWRGARPLRGSRAIADRRRARRTAGTRRAR